MTEPAEAPTIVQKYVLVFDFCSSTSILEDLIRSENQQSWRDLLIGIKKFLFAERDAHRIEIYKFIGDGWILLFDPDFQVEKSTPVEAEALKHLQTPLRCLLPGLSTASLTGQSSPLPYIR